MDTCTGVSPTSTPTDVGDGEEEEASTTCSGVISDHPTPSSAIELNNNPLTSTNLNLTELKSTEENSTVIASSTSITTDLKSVQISKKTVKANIRCDHCSYEFSNTEVMMSHRKVKHRYADDWPNTERSLYKCLYCMFSDELACVVRAHTESEHPHRCVNRKRGLTGNFKCKVCRYRSEGSHSMVIHTRVHTGLKPYRCDECPFRTGAPSTLKTHKMRHSDLKPHACNLCSYRTITAGSLRAHRLTHSDEKPLSCDLCSYRTNQSGRLMSHRRTHEKERPFRCAMCDYGTNQSSALGMHHLSHVVLKVCEVCARDVCECEVYACDSCAYRTDQKGNLETHKMVCKLNVLPADRRDTEEVKDNGKEEQRKPDAE